VRLFKWLVQVNTVVPTIRGNKATQIESAIRPSSLNREIDGESEYAVPVQCCEISREHVV
jgi:hypothetical protein